MSHAAAHAYHAVIELTIGSAAIDSTMASMPPAERDARLRRVAIATMPRSIPIGVSSLGRVGAARCIRKLPTTFRIRARSPSRRTRRVHSPARSTSLQIVAAFPHGELSRLNRANWDDRASAHAASPDYAFERFMADPDFLSEVVRFDLPLLGDVSGVRGVHLQCHIGTDTISLARLGAVMTGLDFSARHRRGRRSRHWPVRRSTSCSRRLRRARRSCTAVASIWSIRESARCAGCPTSGDGPAWWPGCFAPAGGSSSVRATR